MAHRVQSVSMIDQNILQAIFIGGEVIQYDLRKMLSILPQFQEIINDPSLASKVHADTGGYGVSWSDDLDLDSETIWEDGVFIVLNLLTHPSHLLPALQEQENMPC